MGDSDGYMVEFVICDLRCQCGHVQTHALMADAPARETLASIACARCGLRGMRFERKKEMVN